jgi:hypothetical protein
MRSATVACAVVRDTPPMLMLAEDLEVLQRALALRLVARNESPQLTDAQRDEMQVALLDERWGDAIAAWIDHTGIEIDVYTEPILTAADVPVDLVGAELQFAPLFRGS